MNNLKVRNRIEQLFGYPAMQMPWSLYISQLNEAGKLTARSLMDMMIVVLEAIEQMEKEETIYMEVDKPITSKEIGLDLIKTVKKKTSK